MEDFDIPAILRIGVIGLGFLLAFLAFRLIDSERKRKVIRPPAMHAAYLFMLFSIILCAIGLASEFIGKSSAPVDTALPLMSASEIQIGGVLDNDECLSVGEDVLGSGKLEGVHRANTSVVTGSLNGNKVGFFCSQNPSKNIWLIVTGEDTKELLDNIYYIARTHIDRVIKYKASIEE